MKLPVNWTIFLILALFQSVAWADNLNLSRKGADSFSAVEPTTFLPVEEAYQLFPGRQGDTLSLEWLIAPGYYLYQERFSSTILGGTHDGTVLEQSFLPGVTRYDDYYEKDVEVYYNATTLTVKLDPAITDGVLKIESQACADAGLCYPPRTLFVPLNGSAPALQALDSLPDNQPSAPQTSPSSLLLILSFALLGGLILNLMPCVFPILSIKVLSLSQSHLSSHGRHIHGAAYGLGVITSFVAIALGLITLRAGGEALGWGFQLQSPGFITTLIYLFFIMGLSFSGFFEAGTRLMNLGQSASSGHGLRHSFLTGVLATVVASPCSAPFMGTALGFALTQPTSVALLIFAVLGLGMATPFLVLTWMPYLLDHLPKPGPWMEKLKEVLAFPLYLTAVWLLWILGNQTDSATTAVVLCGLTAIAMAIWIGKHQPIAAKAGAVALIAVAIFLPTRALTSISQPPIWQPYSQDRLDTLLDQRKAVFVNLTADWCITCLANEKIVLNSDEFKATLAAEEITYLKGDWTNYDAQITALLNANGRSGVPLYLFYPQGQRNPKILPQILSKSTIENALQLR